MQVHSHHARMMLFTSIDSSSFAIEIENPCESDHPCPTDAYYPNTSGKIIIRRETSCLNSTLPKSSWFGNADSDPQRRAGEIREPLQFHHRLNVLCDRAKRCLPAIYWSHESSPTARIPQDEIIRMLREFHAASGTEPELLCATSAFEQVASSAILSNHCCRRQRFHFFVVICASHSTNRRWSLG